MECKEYDVINNAQGKLDLIDTLWNVKFCTPSTDLFRSLDLIDTLWNVKGVCVVADRREAVDLIDTLWNVKL